VHGGSIILKTNDMPNWADGRPSEAFANRNFGHRLNRELIAADRAGTGGGAYLNRKGKNTAMSDNRLSRRYFFYGTLLAGAVPSGGFGSTPSLKAMGYKSPNEKLNLAAIGAGGQPAADLRLAQAGVENVVALADVDWARGKESFERFPGATKYKDFRQMLDKQGKEIDAVVIGTPDHMHTYCAVACMQVGKHVYVEKPLTRLAGEARLLAQAAERYKVATQMGNQGYSHDATRVACEMIWSGEIGEVKEVHAWTGRPSWPQGMAKIPAPTAVPETLDWNLWLAARLRVPHCGRRRLQAFVAARSARNRPPGAAAGPAGPPPEPRVRLALVPWPSAGFRFLPAFQLARLLRFWEQSDRRLGRAHPGTRELGTAIGSEVSRQRRVHQEGLAAGVHVPRRVGDQVRIRRPTGYARGDDLLVSPRGWRRIHAAGHDG